MKYKNNSKKESDFKKLPSNIKFATFNSNNEDDILLEILIANLIHNGYSIDELLKATDGVDNENDKIEMIEKTLNIILNFVQLNPKYIYVLAGKASSGLAKHFGVNFII